jgi:hypothetical protein
MSVLSEEEKRDIEAKWAWSKKPTNEFIDLINTTEQATINKVVEMIEELINEYPNQGEESIPVVLVLNDLENKLKQG